MTSWTHPRLHLFDYFRSLICFYIFHSCILRTKPRHVADPFKLTYVTYSSGDLMRKSSSLNQEILLYGKRLSVPCYSHVPMRSPPTFIATFVRVEHVSRGGEGEYGRREDMGRRRRGRRALPQ